MNHEKEVLSELDEAARLATQATVCLMYKDPAAALEKLEVSAKKIAHARILLKEMVKP